MNSQNVDVIKSELERLSQIQEFSRIIENDISLINFNADYITSEYEKIELSQQRGYDTHKSEYRVMNTLKTARDKFLYLFTRSTSVSDADKVSLKKELIPISKIINPTLQAVKAIFEEKKAIASIADEFDKLLF
jgi:hypothetical protein